VGGAKGNFFLSVSGRDFVAGARVRIFKIYQGSLYIHRLIDEYTTMYIHQLTDEYKALCSSVNRRI
jgi:hypothetical protein